MILIDSAINKTALTEIFLGLVLKQNKQIKVLDFFTLKNSQITRVLTLCTRITNSFN